MTHLPMPDEQAIVEFAALYEQKTGEKLTPEQAAEYARRALHFVYLMSGRATQSLEEGDKRERRYERAHKRRKRNVMKKHAPPMESHE